MLVRHPLTYRATPHAIVSVLHQLPYFCWLDSGDSGRYSIFTASPFQRLVSDAKQTEIISASNREVKRGDPFVILKQQLQALAMTNETELPFTGGALGYFSYDLANYTEYLPQQSEADIEMPLLQIGIYDWACVLDHQTQQTQVVYHDDLSTLDHREIIAQLTQAIKANAKPIVHYQTHAPFRSNLSHIDYQQAFAKIKTYIHAGDCYEINLSQRLMAPVSGDPLGAYLSLREKINPAYSAFLQTDTGAVLSFSPECFLQLANGIVTSKPIKGTRPRSADKQRDQALCDALQHSEKDRAENLMIVDLLRNDLGKVCQTGSIDVPELFAIESFTNVHHLVSTVTGKLAPNIHAMDVLRACFPGGSITGAPKIRAMEIIDELEPQRRSVYCGAIGYIDFSGNMTMNIAIRTLLWHQNTIYCAAGGAIVADSDCEAEYQETFSKIQNLLDAL